ncbi:MAG: FAD-dependent oxidoreductase [Rhodospirillales bacterium]|nr:MAG: FAD-dependent oxidoreductase [Rhodospirillales bacterium]
MVKPEKSANPRIAIIGAGMAGLTCARHLADSDISPTVFDKGRGLGGRLATRRLEDGAAFDHGAQYVTAEGTAFREFVTAAIGGGTAAHWSPVSQESRPAAKSRDWIVGLPRMNGLVRPLAEGLDLRLRVEVKAIERAASGWRLRTASDATSEVFDIVAVTAPAPQAATLAAAEPGLRGRLEHVSMAPCWALMVAFETQVDRPFDVVRGEAADIDWIARNNSKPGRAASPECWVVHASPSWSTRHLELDREVARAKLLALLGESLEPDLPEIRHAIAHRWRYARTTAPLGAPFLSSDDETLFLGGDWCLGARVECAFESGRAIAAALREAVDRR